MLVVILNIAFSLLVLLVLVSMVVLATNKNLSEPGRKNLKRLVVKGMLWILICAVLWFLFYFLPMATAKT